MQILPQIFNQTQQYPSIEPPGGKSNGALLTGNHFYAGTATSDFTMIILTLVQEVSHLVITMRKETVIVIVITI